MLSCDVVIVGAGLAGLSTARSCLQRGLSVVVVDAQASPGWSETASGLNCGLIEPLSSDLFPAPTLQAHLLQETSREIEELHVAGCDLEFSRCGALELLSTQEHVEHASASVAQERAAGMCVELLSAEHVREREPRIDPKVCTKSRCTGNDENATEPQTCHHALVHGPVVHRAGHQHTYLSVYVRSCRSRAQFSCPSPPVSTLKS